MLANIPGPIWMIAMANFCVFLHVGRYVETCGSSGCPPTQLMCSTPLTPSCDVQGATRYAMLLSYWTSTVLLCFLFDCAATFQC